MGDLSGEAVMAIEWTLFGLACIMVGLRIGVRMARRQQRQLIVSDIFLVTSMIICLGLIICDTWTYSLGGMSNSTAEDTGVTASDMANEVVLDKISFASDYFYDTGMYFPKATLLALYFKLFPKTMPRLRTMLYVVTGYTFVCALTTCFLDTFYCHNVPDNWSLKEGACSTFNSMLVLQIDWALNFSSDLAIFALPFPLIRYLHLARGQWYGLVLTFALGIVTIAVNLGRFISISTGHSWNGVFVWSMAEMTVAIIVVSLPALKTLVVRYRKSSKSQSGSRSNGQYATRSHHKLTSREDTRRTNIHADDTGSDVELNHVGQTVVIYKTHEISVDSQPAGEEGGQYSQSWNDSGFR